MKLCVFQGTFNPIHNSHIRIAEYAYKHKNFDKILFIPAARPPHKAYIPDMSIHRYNMVKLVTDSYPEFDISDIEYRFKDKSYTFNTISELYKSMPVEGKINFLIGTDAFRKIESWYRSDELKDLLNFIIFLKIYIFFVGFFSFQLSYYRKILQKYVKKSEKIQVHDLV